MIRFDHVTFTYPDAARPVLRDVSLVVPDGELCLVVGHTGSGKSTLLRAVNGLVPHFTGGRLEGTVEVEGVRTDQVPPRELAHLVGIVGQSPSAGFVTDVVEDELAYTMENLGIAPDVMRRRVEDVLDLLHLHPVRHRPLGSLSSGQQQRVAIGAVLTASPRVLVLDEPTSALDPGAAEEVLAALTRLVHDLGITVLLAEHRLERVIQYADRVVTVIDGTVAAGDPAEVMDTAPVIPPVVALGRLAGWSPLPLSVRDARRRAGDLRVQLGDRPTPSALLLPIAVASAPESVPAGAGSVAPIAAPIATPPPPTPTEPVAVAERVSARYGSVIALRDVDLAVRPGEIVAVMGRNGAGKSTLLAHLAGLATPTSGRVRILGVDPHAVAAKELVRKVALVPSDPGLLLYEDSVRAECASADRDAALPAGTTAAAVAEIVADLTPDDHPRDLSEGQRLGLALGVVLAPAPPVLLLDEPTRGLDYAAKSRLVLTVRRLAAAGRAVVLASHDVELVAELAHRVVVLADGEVVADGPAREVVCQSPIFAPQIAKVLAPAAWLTVAEVAAAMAS